jgi:hypothetical protein
MDRLCIKLASLGGRVGLGYLVAGKEGSNPAGERVFGVLPCV